MCNIKFREASFQAPPVAVVCGGVCVGGVAGVPVVEGVGGVAGVPMVAPGPLPRQPRPHQVTVAHVPAHLAPPTAAAQACKYNFAII